MKVDPIPLGELPSGVKPGSQPVGTPPAAPRVTLSRQARIAAARGATALPAGAAVSVSPEVVPLFTLSFTGVRRFFFRQSPSYWFMSLYLFFEYVRPQQIYDAMNGPPWNKIWLVLAGVSFLAEGRKIRWGIAESWLALFSVIVIASSMTAIYPDVSFSLLFDYLNWVIIYILIANTITTEGRLFVFVLMFMVWNFKMSLHGARSWAQEGFAFRDWGTTGSPGFFQNSGEFGIEMCIFVAMLGAWITGLRVHWKRWQLWAWLFVGSTAVVSLVASNSRGAILGAGAVVIARMARSKHKWRALVAAVTIAGFAYAIMPEETRARYTTMGNDKTSIQRYEYWKQGLDMLQNHPALGIGYKNWLTYHTAAYPGPHQVSHNIFIEVSSELGYAGFFGFLGLIAATLTLNYRTRKLLKDQPAGRFMYEMSLGFDAALFGYLVAGFFVTVFYYPFFWINLAFSAALYNSACSAVAPPVQQAAVRRRRA